MSPSCASPAWPGRWQPGSRTTSFAVCAVPFCLKSRECLVSHSRSWKTKRHSNNLSNSSGQSSYATQHSARASFRTIIVATWNRLYRLTFVLCHVEVHGSNLHCEWTSNAGVRVSHRRLSVPWKVLAHGHAEPPAVNPLCRAVPEIRLNRKGRPLM